jgi:hypothetical protein
VSRKYGVESETVITLFNVADFLAASGGSEDDSEGSSDDGGSGGCSGGLVCVKGGSRQCMENLLLPFCERSQTAMHAAVACFG